MTTRVHRAAVLEAASDFRAELSGEVGQRVEAAITQWILPAPRANPDMLEMFQRRNREPFQLNVPWAGEYAGKYLTHAAGMYGLTRDERLAAHLEEFVTDLIALQEPDGYLGTFPPGDRLRPGGGPIIEMSPPRWVFETPWDAWGQYHVMLGLLSWYRWATDERALEAAVRCADFFANLILGRRVALSSLGAVEMNQAPVHAFAVLHSLTGEARFLQLAEAVVADFETPGAGDYLRVALAGEPFYKGPRPRWESLHAIQALAELFLATGKSEYRAAFEEIWWSIAEYDRHPTGGFGAGEKACGDPLAIGSLETCCTVAWLALSVDQLRITGDSIVADELELATLNAGLGALSRSGRWVTYDTPLDGRRRAMSVDHPWQARAGAPELSCCAANGQRVLSLIADWALMVGTHGLVLNWYGPGRLTASLPVVGRVTLDVRTEYPLDGKVVIEVVPDGDHTFGLSLRIPHWSSRTSVLVDGEKISVDAVGRYLRIERRWRRGEQIELQLDLALHAWRRPRVDGADSAVLYRGPLLLAYDPRLDTVDRSSQLTFSAANLNARRRVASSRLKPWLLVEVQGVSGAPIPLCDFASAGEAGDPYRSWFSIDGLEAPRFQRRAPLRTVPVGGRPSERPPSRLAETSDRTDARNALAVHVVREMPHPAQDVWKLVGDWSALATYGAGVARCQADSSEAGAIRHVVLVDGTAFAERLLEIDSSARTYRYQIVDVPPAFPIEDYVSVVTITELGATRCRLEWAGYFVGHEVDDADAESFIRRAYEANLDSLATILKTQSLLT